MKRTYVTGNGIRITGLDGAVDGGKLNKLVKADRKARKAYAIERKEKRGKKHVKR